MWQNKFIGVLGLWIIALAFLGFSDSLQRFLLVLTGLCIVLVTFWGKKLIKPTKDLAAALPKTEEKKEGNQF